MKFFWHDGLVQEFFSYAYALAGYFFSKSPNPPSEVKWSAARSRKPDQHGQPGSYEEALSVAVFGGSIIVRIKWEMALCEWKKVML